VTAVFTKTRLILQMIKFEHTIFALPFAFISVILAAQHLGATPPPSTLGWVLLAMVGARSAAMSFNRLSDAEIDARNPRTASRHIPSGLLTRVQVAAFLCAAVALFEIAAFKLNRLCFVLSPVALISVLGYSYTKRFTSLCHLFLGFAIGIAPLGAWLAVVPQLHPIPLALGAVVMLWIGGFDIIYALQDYDFDRQSALFSLPKKLGKARALMVSRMMHLGAISLLCWIGMLAGLHGAYFVGVTVVAGLIAWEQSLVKPDDLRKVDMAFFTLNGWVSVSLFAFVLIDALLKR
jgi:4-hydroxybenzoate polyprenyltransferase